MSEAVLPADLQPYAGNPMVRFGTSSFSSKDWVGPFYPKGTPPGAFLGHYARTFDTVEIDATWYAIPNARLVDGWVAKTPDRFRICAKFPRTIVHGGNGAKPNPAQLLMPDATYADRDHFLEVIQRLGPRLHTLLIQFPYFNRTIFPSAGSFFERLDDFLRDLPKEGLRYAVEIRNKAWLTPEYRDLLARHGVAMTLVDHAWMPHGDTVAERFDVATGSDIYIRLLGDRKRIEAITKTCEKEVLDAGPSIDRWATLLRTFLAQGRRSLVFVSKHYAGHAPTAVRRLMSALAQQLTGEQKDASETQKAP